MARNWLWTSPSRGKARLHVNGAVLTAAQQAKGCWELLEGARCHLVVVGIETDGRWSVLGWVSLKNLREPGRLKLLFSGQAAKMVSDNFHLLQLSNCMFFGGFSSGSF